MQRSEGLMYVGIPEQVDKYLVTHNEYQLIDTFEMRQNPFAKRQQKKK